MVNLNVNLDQVAMMRQIRGGKNPDPVQAAVLSEIAGAHSITIHLREDRKHIQDRDAYLLKQTVSTKLNLEIAPTADMIRLAKDIFPHMATIVSEKTEGRKVEGGLSLRGKERDFRSIVKEFHDHNIVVSLFVDPDLQEIKSVYKIGATYVELNTGHYANAIGQHAQDEELIKLQQSIMAAHKYGITVNLGQGLDYTNSISITKLDHINELIIGHSIIARAMLVGLDTAVRDVLTLF